MMLMVDVEAISSQYNSTVLSFFLSWPDYDVIMSYIICIHNIYVYYTALFHQFVNGIVWYCLVSIHGIAWFDKRA